MRIVFGSDHAGLDAKRALMASLANAGHELMDLGTDSHESCDYPDFAGAVARAVATGEADRGVLICGTGQGVAMSANKVPGARAGVVTDAFSAAMIREHNDAKIICFGARIIAQASMERLLSVFLATDFAGGRHQRRVDKLEGLSQG